jgi:Rieske Fe-S protein
MTTNKISRRTLGGLAAAGVGAPLLAACGSDDPETASDPTGAPGSSSPSTGSATTSSAPPTDAGSTSAAPGGGDALTTTGDIEVGGGAIFPDEEVVVTQPSQGEFKCFTAICSHQGCLVSDVSDGTINCDCHGSKYDIETGDVVQGPATFALAEEQISVSGDQISLA